MLLRVLLCILSVGLLTACGEAVQTSHRLVLSTTDDGLVPAALGATADQFIGAPAARPTKPGGGATHASWLRLDRDTLSPDSDTPHRRTVSQRVALRSEARLPLGHGFEGVGALTASASRSRYALPKGLGVLADPTQIGFDAVALDPSLGLNWAHPLMPGARAHLGLAVGQEVARVRTTVRSSLLDVTNLSTQRQGYVEVAAGLELAPPRPGAIALDFVVVGRRYDGDAVVVSSQLRLRR